MKKPDKTETDWKQAYHDQEILVKELLEVNHKNAKILSETSVKLAKAEKKLKAISDMETKIKDLTSLSK